MSRITLRRRLSLYVRTPAIEARAKRVRYLTNGDARHRLRQLIRVMRALRLQLRNPPRLRSRFLRWARSQILHEGNES